MTDKKKLDEQAILNVQSTQEGMTADTTFVADDVLALAQMLKNAGIESGQFNGPAILSVEASEGTGSMTSRIQAPDLRSIMKLLEPEFQAAGDLEAGVQDMAADMEVPAEEPCVDGACNAPVDAVAPEVDMGMDLEEPAIAPTEEPPVMDDYEAGFADAKRNEGGLEEQALNENSEDDVFDILDYACGLVAAGAQEGSEEFDLGDDLAELHFVAAPYEQDNYNADQSVISGLMAKYGVEEPYESGIWNDDERGIALYYIVQSFGEVEESTTMQPYAGVADKQIVQPKTHAVPARSGDNPLGEGNNPFGERTLDTYLRDGEVMVMYDHDSGDFDTGLDSPSVASTGLTVTINSVVDQFDNELLDSLTPEERNQLEQECIDDLNSMEESAPAQVAGPKSFKDYFREAAERNVEENVEVEEAVTAESLISELGRYGSKNWAAERDRKDNQFGAPFFLNTDCGYASLNDLGAHDYFQHDGVVVLAINRNGKWGLNYVAGSDNTAPGTKVTCVTQTSTGQKYREGKVVDSFTMDEYQNDRAGLEARLAKHGITPTKKLSVKTFD